MEQSVENLFRETNGHAYGFDLQQMVSLQLTEYNEEYQGHYDWHEDLDWKSPRPFQRKLSLVVQLSRPDEYEGGQLELAQDNPTNPAEFRGRGTAILFPAFLRHRVSPVTRGTRYSLVSWMEGPNFR
jgi:PKHD-type hydroxylase